VGGDVSKREDVERMVAEVVDKFGRLDIVVNNAGIEIKRPFLEVSDEEWDTVINVNLFGSYLVSQVAAQQMVKQDQNLNGHKQGGKLIFISSVHEDIPFPEYTAYCASKGGVRMMMRNLAMELAPYRINVNNVAPGQLQHPSTRRCSMTRRPARMRSVRFRGAASAHRGKSLPSPCSWPAMIRNMSPAAPTTWMAALPNR
jgi:glucose 1-dehydrogenase